MRVYHLSPVFPVNFISVIFYRIMACSYNYSCKTSFISYTKRQFRSRSQIRINICLYSVCRHYSCSIKCIFPRTYSAVMSNYYSSFLCFFFVIFKHIVSKPLCCFSYYVFINSVCSYSSYSSYSPCTKAQILKKSVFDFFLIIF